MAARAHEKGLQIISFVREDVLCSVEGDPTRLRQVLLNLVGNAIKFTERGEVHLSVARVSLKGQAQKLRFEIIDMEIGVSRDLQARLFETFTQAGGSTTRKSGGPGPGLYIVRQGLVWVQSG